ncbi:hypothetical protein [Caulobacter sp. Root1455]|uniref:hypothetical protein n=1 Tax=Caulobacter sp. Root1455 TaxID=1736465 RepID=UPI000AC4369A|nr:hypothetical protein [Caulobacter sp. Root1455]
MFEFDQFWVSALAGATPPTASNLDGWKAPPGVPTGFIEPTFSVIAGDPAVAKIFIVSAPGAVGKSTVASALASVAGYALVDLAKTTPMGGNFFKGGLANAFGFDALPRAANGEIGLIIDGLDEAQLRAAPAAFEAALVDLGDIVASEHALPTVLLGRALSAENAALILELAGHNVCTFQIEFFDDDQARRYIQTKCSSLAERHEKLREAYLNHSNVFHALAEETRNHLAAVSGGADPRFSGYAPVLDAICEFSLDPEQQNPSVRLASLYGDTPVELVEAVSQAILVREQGKLLSQLIAAAPQLEEGELTSLYGPDEQRHRVLSRILGVAAPAMPPIAESSAQDAYAEMVEQFIAQHPFLDGGARRATNLVFSADLAVWALTGGKLRDEVRAALNRDPSLLSGLLFELYAEKLGSAAAPALPLADAGILYQALQAQVGAKQRALIDVSSNEDDEISVSFEVTDQDRPDLERSFGPYNSTNDTALELRAPFSHVYVDAPIWVALGDGNSQQIGSPTEIRSRELSISARQLFVHGASGLEPDGKIVTLAADDVDVQSVQNITVNGALLSVVWNGSNIHPWNPYSADVSSAPSPDMDFMRRRLRKILTSFRSHSKGKLVRFAPKIDSLRMTKDARGEKLVSALLNDGILDLFDNGKFYVLDPDKMGSLLGVDYHALQQQRYTNEVDAYLQDVLAR